MNQRNTLYIDVTQLVHWQGFVAGIPRVMYELSRRFTADDKVEVCYVSWVKEVKAYCQVDFFDTMQRRKKGGGISYIYRESAVGEGGESHQHMNERLSSMKRFAKGEAKRLIKSAGMENHPFFERLKSGLAQKEATRYKTICFAEGDTVFIPWGEWWDENFLAMLEQAVASVSLKIVPIIHDVLPFTQTPQFSGHSTDSLKEYCRRIVPISSVVLCVSKSTRNDLMGWLKHEKIEVPRMEVFRLGEDFEFLEAKVPDDENFIMADIKGSDYLLCVGTFEAKKNHTLLYYVYKLAKARGVVLPKLIIVGRRGWKTEYLYDFMTEDPEVRDQFVFLNNASDENLSWLYDHALATVFPSFAEGWGMPIAESVARGVPCACSNTTSMTEIAEEYVKHFSPASTDECLETIREIIKPEVQKEMRIKNKQYHQTTWDNAFNQIWNFMKESVYGR